MFASELWAVLDATHSKTCNCVELTEQGSLGDFKALCSHFQCFKIPFSSPVFIFPPPILIEREMDGTG